MPAIQSVGLGSDVLKQSQIDDLKAVDEEILLDPIKKNLEQERTKDTDLSSLTIVASAAKAAQNPLYEDLSYTKTKTAKDGDSVEITVQNGVSPRTMDFKVEKLANKEIIESNSFFAKTEAIVAESSTLEFYVKNSKYSIDIIGTKNLKEGQEATSYASLIDLISDKTNGNIIASILEIGGDTPYKMILQTKNEGELNKIIMGPTVLSTKPIDLRALEDVLFMPKDITINGIQLLDGATRASIKSKSILLPEPKIFGAGDFSINKVDIFNTSDPTFFEGEEKASADVIVKNSDLKINGIDIFTDSSRPEIQSNVNMSDISFPLNLKTQGLSINGIDIFNNISSTSVLSGTLNNKVVAASYNNNNLVINGVNIFEEQDGNPVNITTVQDLVNSINRKKDITNATAELVKVDNNNSRILIKSSVAGDNIDIYTNDNIKFSKFRLTQGSTKGEDSQLILNTNDLLTTINSKSADTKVEAIIRDGKLTLISANTDSVEIKTLNQLTLSALGLQAGISRVPVGFKINSLANLAEVINKKTSTTKVEASVMDNKIVLTSEKGGDKLTITGSSEILSQFGLQDVEVEPLKQKTIKDIDDIIKSINTHKEQTQVEAVKQGDIIVLKAIKDSIDIDITGKTNELAQIGFEKATDRFKNGQIISSKQQLADFVNAKAGQTDVNAVIRNNKLLLYNSQNTNIVIAGNTEKLETLGLSEELSRKTANKIADITLYKKLGLNDEKNLIQKASNAIFSYNNVKLERDTNTINDLVVGVSIKLKKEDTDTSKSSINIELDTSLVEQSVKEFVTAYNSFVRKLEDLTKFEYDAKKGIKDSTTGSFQGIPDVVNIPYRFNSLIARIDSSLKDITSLKDLGISFADRSNTLNIVESTLTSAIASNFEEVDKLLRGHKYTDNSGREREFEGIFTKINAEFNNLTEGENSVFELLEDKISANTSRLQASLEKNQKYLDDKYEAMKQDYIANDLAISKANNNFSSLKQQIDIETAKK